MATLLRQGARLCELDEFETWVELSQSGRWSRRCLFSAPGSLRTADFRDPELAVMLDDGTRWSLQVLRAAAGATPDAPVLVTSALLEPLSAGAFTQEGDTTSSSAGAGQAAAPAWRL